ncbi:magnesium ion transporter [Cladophialophora chaetospira]|uniref:Magnesium transporter n=1 Tax=Cladophialophora chaetospira TaxID=386627 RepID=A0AA38WZN8_9EURO|nr:magnesium ion transporter [Cladophialophora chaetospira]
MIWHRRLSSSQRISSSLQDPLANSTLDTTATNLNTNTKNDKITCIYFDKNGRLDNQHKQLTKAEIAEQFELRHRDLRDIDLRSEGVTRILVRPKTILLQFFHMCMIIQADEALLINNTPPTTPDDEQAVQARRKQFYDEFERRMSGQANEAADVPELPYELRAVEAAILAVLSRLHREFIDARTKSEEAARLLRLDSGAGSFGLDRVFERTRTLAKIEQKARLVRDTIRDVLDADEDLAGMYLSDRLAGKPHDISDHQEAEYMLEAYHKAADTLVESSQAMVDVLRKKENTFRSSLAVQRNQIMFLEARIAIHTLGLASGTMVAGLFGMNLVNYLEESPYGFFLITGFCVVLSGIFSMYGMRSLWRIQSLKGIRRSRVEGR